MSRISVLILASIIAVCTAGSALAGTVVYSNLNTDPTALYSGTAYVVSGPASTTQQYLGVASAFTPSITVTFTELDMGLQYFSGTNLFTVELLSDASGSPGSMLESWSVNNALSSQCCILQVLAGTGLTTLNGGSQYWIAVLPGAVDTFVGWNLNNTGDIGNFDGTVGSGWINDSPSTKGAFEVQGSVPEPASAALVLAGGLLGILFGRRKRRGDA